MKKNVRRGRYWWTAADVYSDQVIRGKWCRCTKTSSARDKPFKPRFSTLSLSVFTDFLYFVFPPLVYFRSLSSFFVFFHLFSRRVLFSFICFKRILTFYFFLRFFSLTFYIPQFFPLTLLFFLTFQNCPSHFFSLFNDSSKLLSVLWWMLFFFKLMMMICN